MLIESLIKPRNKPQRAVKCFGIEYAFKEVAPGRFVASVSDQRAIDAFINVKPAAYREFTDKLESGLAAPAAAPGKPAIAASAKPITLDEARAMVAAADAAAAAGSTVTDAVKPADPPAGDNKPADPAGKPDEAPLFTAEDQAAAEALLSGNPAQVLKRAKTATKAVLLAALTIEKKAAKPRASVLTGLGA